MKNEAHVQTLTRKSRVPFTSCWLFCLAVLGPDCLARAVSSCDEWGLLPVAVHGPLTEGSSVVAEQRLQELWHMGSVVVQSSIALQHVESSQTRV